MAVLPLCPGISAAVIVGDMAGPPTTEYDDPAGASPESPRTQYGTCTKFVESADDARFGFEFSIDPRLLWDMTKKDEMLEFQVSIDGVEVGGKGFCQGDQSGVMRMISRSVGGKKHRLFKFAKLQTVEDASARQLKKDGNTAKRLGVLAISIQRVKVTGTIRPGEYKPLLIMEGTKLHEKALKGRSISHHATDALTEGVDQDSNLVEDIGVPCGFIYFKYGSMNDLYNEGVVARPASPSDSQEPTEVDDMDIEQLRRIARAHLEGKRKIKKEEDIDAMSKRRIIKRGREEDEDRIDVDALDEARERRPRVTIDLTDD